MERKRRTTNPLVAVLIALIVLVIIFFTIHKELPQLQGEFRVPLPQALSHPAMWLRLGDVIFHTAGLLIVYGLIALIFPALRFVLNLGTGLLNLAGIPYLLSAMLSLRSRDPGVSLQQALFMFLLCMLMPYLTSRLFGWIKNL